MKPIGDVDLKAAVTAGILSPQQLQALRAFLQTRQPVASASRFDLSHLFWYAGALIVIGAMGLFSTLAFDQMGGRALTATAAIYALVFILSGHHLWQRPAFRAPAGLLIAVAVSMAPLAIFGIQAEFGLWPTPFNDPGGYGAYYDWINGSWVYMDLGTILAGCIALRFYPFAFITAIMAVALWFLSMDLTPWIFHQEYFTWTMRCQVSAAFGLALILLAWIVDLKRWQAGDIGFWLHLCGLAAFWGGLSTLDSNSELSKAIYCLINIVLVLLSVYLMRRVYAVFGAIGIAGYLGELADGIFAYSLIFPFALSLIGIGFIAAGIIYVRQRHKIAAWVQQNLPAGLQRLRPLHARGAVA
ncbi:MAG TPA: hypothetical protein VF920_02745 [Dongiaceae bacterium]